MYFSGMNSQRTWHCQQETGEGQPKPQRVHQFFTPKEDEIIISAHYELGNKWTQIARRLPGLFSRPFFILHL
jgi:hypothetical protein